MYFGCSKWGNIRTVKSKPKKEVMKRVFTLFNCPYLQLLTLILEDRVQFSVSHLINNVLPRSEFKDNKKVIDLCNCLITDKKNPAKRGLIGKYNHELMQNLTEHEQLAFTEACEAFDEAIKFPERILKAKLREFSEGKIKLNEFYVEVCYCEILANYTHSIHNEICEKVPDTEFYLRNMKWNGNTFYMIESILDQIAVIASGGIPMDYTQFEPFNRAYSTFAGTINNDSRLKREYEKICKKRDEYITDPNSNIDILRNNIFSQI